MLTALIISYWFSLKLRVSNSKKEASTYVYACRKYHNDMIPVHLPGTCTDMRKGKLFCNTKMDKVYPLLLRRNFLCPSAFLMRIETIIIVHPSFSFERMKRKFILSVVLKNNFCYFFDFQFFIHFLQNSTILALERI